jgi:hypothetical protein
MKIDSAYSRGALLGEAQHLLDAGVELLDRRREPLGAVAALDRGLDAVHRGLQLLAILLGDLLDVLLQQPSGVGEEALGLGDRAAIRRSGGLVAVRRVVDAVERGALGGRRALLLVPRTTAALGA